MKLILKEHRLRKGLSLHDLAQKVGYSASYLSLIENHKESPRLITIRKIGLALEMCPKKLIYTCSCMNKCDNCHYK